MLLDEIKPLIHWIHEHPDVGGAATFVIAFLESLAIVGLFIPGSVMMTAIGTLIGSGTLPVTSTLLLAAAGAIVGDVMSFGLGKYYQERLLQIWPISRFPKLIANGQTFFKNKGVISVFLGRFLGPLRPIIPMVAGMMNMSTKRFLIADSISAFFWAPGYMILGLLLGAVSTALPPQAAKRFIVLVLLVVVALWLAIWLWRKLARYFGQYWQSLLAHSWQRLANKPGRLYRILHCEEAHENPKQLQRLFILALFCILAVYLCIDHLYGGPLTQLNQTAYHFFRSLRTTTGQQFMLIIAVLGQKKVILPTFLIAACWMAYKRIWRTGWHWLSTVILAAGATFVGKRLFDVARPTGIALQKDSESFPSGHATLSTVLCLSLAMVITRQLPRKYSPWIYSLAILGFSLVMLSRVYLGVHWMMDTLAGVTVGTLATLAVGISYHRKPCQRLPLLSFSLIVALSISCLGGAYLYKKWDKKFHNTQLVWHSQTISEQDWWSGDNTLAHRRLDRLGHRTQILNVQWLGDISAIKKVLQQQGWHPAPKRNMVSFISTISQSRNTPRRSLLPPIHQDQDPVLTMLKRQHKQMVALRLWRANTYLSNSTQPLWIGEVYNLPLHAGLIHMPYHDKPKYVPPHSQTALLEHDLAYTDWLSKMRLLDDKRIVLIKKLNRKP